MKQRATSTTYHGRRSRNLHRWVACTILSVLLVATCEDHAMAEAAGCNMCANNTVIAHPSRIIPSFEVAGTTNPTCQQALLHAQNQLDPDTSSCDLMQHQAAYCGCRDPDDDPASEAPPTNYCPLCPGGVDEPTLGSKIAPVGATCDVLNQYLGYQSPSECKKDRSKELIKSSFLCGCENAAKPSCVMCPDGTNNLKYPDRIVPFYQIGSLTQPTCQQIADSAAISGTSTCSLLQEQAQYCGCAEIEPLNKCSFCPIETGAGVSTEVPANADLVTPSGSTCKLLNKYVQYQDEAFCESSRFDTIQASAYTCGCQHAEPKCTLCPNGDAPRRPDWRFANDERTCASHALTVQSSDASTCEADRTLNELFAFRCDCKGAQVPECTVRRNEEMCVPDLFDVVPPGNEECECYSFCVHADGTQEFLQCDFFPGADVVNCTGTTVTGCNPRLAGILPSAGWRASVRASLLMPVAVLASVSILTWDMLVPHLL